MDTKIKVIIGVITLMVVITGMYVSLSNTGDVVSRDTLTDVTITQQNETFMTDDMVKNNDIAQGSYQAYSSEKISRAENGNVILFFHASWCPSCRALNSDIEANMNAIPEGITILKVDYDTEVALKKKYDITYQHTLVQVTKDGELIKKWSGGSKLTNVIEEIQ